MFQASTPFRFAAAVPLFACVALLAGCKKAASPEECRAAITHMMEVQIDGIDVPGGAQGMPAGSLDEGKRWLKSQVPSMIKPEMVDQCVARMPRADALCTVTANTTEALVNQCHWKPVAGPKGAALGF